MVDPRGSRPAARPGACRRPRPPPPPSRPPALPPPGFPPLENCARPPTFASMAWSVRAPRGLCRFYAVPGLCRFSRFPGLCHFQGISLKWHGRSERTNTAWSIRAVLGPPLGRGRADGPARPLPQVGRRPSRPPGFHPWKIARGLRLLLQWHGRSERPGDSVVFMQCRDFVVFRDFLDFVVFRPSW